MRIHIKFMNVYHNTYQSIRPALEVAIDNQHLEIFQLLIDSIITISSGEDDDNIIQVIINLLLIIRSTL